MADPRVHELQALLPRCLLPDWVRLGSRLILVDAGTGVLFGPTLNKLPASLRAAGLMRSTRWISNCGCAAWDST